MSVYEEICRWIKDDVIADIQDGVYDEDNLDTALENAIEQNMNDLGESIWDRKPDMYYELKEELKEMRE